ncbi:hypothetical protein LQV63_01285 [Paenibacillus profundus]|uniref:Uncharacterized protein n=1 Tax=Paenibacillus profundus TaxID=1173085 RepID=A0ABS8YBT9_9BACL|nr:hypothetical protein [Paenibacillus profundus]MCE5167950.1 hypothetical protein [Paenibacillus profundus]
MGESTVAALMRSCLITSASFLQKQALKMTIHLAETVRPFNKDGRAVSTRDRNPS